MRAGVARKVELGIRVKLGPRVGGGVRPGEGITERAVEVGSECLMGWEIVGSVGCVGEDGWDGWVSGYAKRMGVLEGAGLLA